MRAISLAKSYQDVAALQVREKAMISFLESVRAPRRRKEQGIHNEGYLLCNSIYTYQSVYKGRTRDIQQVEKWLRQQQVRDAVHLQNTRVT